MKFSPVNVEGAFVVELSPIVDDRGFFARAYCEREFLDNGINVRMVQENMSYNRQRGILRGLHWQASPHEEAKFVRCIKGSIFDVVVDVRPDSATYKQWYGIDLTSTGRQALFIPGGCAHGYQVLEDDTELLYKVSAPYMQEAERGARWNDPAFGIEWPIKEGLILSSKDKDWDDF
jgi:dTDP-4-dehydrorhamnose 3,5-epimerase